MMGSLSSEVKWYLTRNSIRQQIPRSQNLKYELSVTTQFDYSQIDYSQIDYSQLAYASTIHHYYRFILHK